MHEAISGYAVGDEVPHKKIVNIAELGNQTVIEVESGHVILCDIRVGGAKADKRDDAPSPGRSPRGGELHQRLMKAGARLPMLHDPAAQGDGRGDRGERASTKAKCAAANTATGAPYPWCPWFRLIWPH